MSGETEKNISGWTVDTLKEHVDTIEVWRKALMDERDRRYSEVKAADERAIRVKESADERALLLAREIQSYKDEKANNLRAQIEGERGTYATRTDLKSATEKIEVMLDPLVKYVALQQGRSGGFYALWTVASAAALIVLAALVFFVKSA